MNQTLARRLFFRALLVSLCATAALAVGILLFAEFDETSWRILATTALVSAFSLLSLPAGVLLDRGRGIALAWAVVALSAGAFALALVVVWGDTDDVWKPLVTLTAAAGACSQAAASTSRRRPDDGRRVVALHRTSILLSTLVAALIVIAAWGEIDTAGYYRALGALVVVALLSVLLQPVVRRLRAGPPAGARLVFRLDRPPSPDAVRAAVDALERHGARVDEVESRGGPAAR